MWFYIIKYNYDEHKDENIGLFCINLSNTEEVKLLMKAEFEKAEKIGYRFGRKLACKKKTV